MLVSGGCHREGLTMKLTNTSLLTRLFTGFGAILALSCLLGLIALQKLETVSGLTQDLYYHSLGVTTSVLEANADIIAMHRSMKDVALAQDAAGIDSAAQAVDASEKKVFTAMAIAQERFLGERKEFEETLQAIRDWQPIRADVIRAMKAGDRETGATITKTKGAAQVKLIAERMEALVTGVKQRAASFAASATETGSQAKTLVTSALVVMIVLGGLIAWAITRSVRGPIGKLRVIMERLAKQDYSAEVPFTANTNEIGQIAKAVAFFKENGLAVERLRNE